MGLHIPAIRIAHIMAGAPHGGAELFFERLCIAQYEQGLPILPVIRKNKERADRLIQAGLFPQELPFGGWMDWQTGGKIRKLLEEFSPQVAIAWMNRAAHFMPKGDWVSIGRLGGFYNLKYYRNCEYLVGNTRGIVQWVKEQGWPAKRVHYVPNFAREFTSQVSQWPSMIPTGRPFVLALGRLHKNKGFDVLIHAISQLNDVQLLIAGEGPERGNLEQLSKQLGVDHRVYMPGWVENIGNILAACSILVCSSRHEPLGNTVLEGFAARKPVVAMASQGPTELIVNQKDGLLTPLEDASAMASAIAKCLKNPELADQFAQAGRTKFEHEYSKETVLHRWLEFLSEVRKV